MLLNPRASVHRELLMLPVGPLAAVVVLGCLPGLALDIVRLLAASPTGPLARLILLPLFLGAIWLLPLLVCPLACVQEEPWQWLDRLAREFRSEARTAVRARLADQLAWPV